MLVVHRLQIAANWMELAYANVMMHAKVAGSLTVLMSLDSLTLIERCRHKTRLPVCSNVALAKPALMNLRRFLRMAGSSGLRNGFVSSSSCNVLGTVAMPCNPTQYKLKIVKHCLRQQSLALAAWICPTWKQIFCCMYGQEPQNWLSHAPQCCIITMNALQTHDVQAQNSQVMPVTAVSCFAYSTAKQASRHKFNKKPQPSQSHA